MTIDKNSYANFLEKVAEDIDIAPSKYQQAVDRYKVVGHWLEDGGIRVALTRRTSIRRDRSGWGPSYGQYEAARRRITISTSCANCRSLRIGRMRAR